MDFGKLKDLALQARDGASSGLQTAKKSMEDIAENSKRAVPSFSMEDVTAKMNVCQQYFSESELLQKLAKVAKSAGAGIIYPVLLLFNILNSAEVDNSQKAMILGALGYFILPLDIIPDAIPIEGFADDMAAMTFVLKACAANATEFLRRESKDKLHKWLGDYDESLTNGVDKIMDTDLIK